MPLIAKRVKFEFSHIGGYENPDAMIRNGSEADITGDIDFSFTLSDEASNRIADIVETEAKRRIVAIAQKLTA
jgi:hypothetical protein